MSATIANDLFAVMEKQMGAEAARAAAAAYLANSQGSAAVPADKPKRKSQFDGMSEEEAAAKKAEIGARLKAGREAKKAAEKAAGGAPAEPVKAAAPVASAPVAAAPTEAEKQKAKMKANREAALAKKAAEKAAGGAPAEPVKAAEPSPQSDSSGPKKRGPKPLAEMNAEERAAHDAKVAERAAKKAAEKAAVQPPVTAQQADPTIFAEFTHKGVKYLRNMRGDLLTTEYDWVGRFDGKNINTQFPKPADLEEEEEEAAE